MECASGCYCVTCTDIMHSRSSYIQFIVLILLCWGGGVRAQISEGGLPKSFGAVNIDEDLVIQLDFDKPITDGLLLEDVDRDGDGLNLRDAVAVPIDRGLNDSGTWFALDDGASLWRLSIRVQDAFSLEPYFDQFFMPPGGELHIFNDTGTEIFGAYTDNNNSSHGRLSAEMIQGDIINFEYYEPASVQGEGILHILDLGYRYRDVIGLDPSNTEGGSHDCQVDVTCEEGLLWNKQSRSTVRVRTRVNGEFFWCTGTLMNNTSHDCRPLILTSLRCAMEGSDMSSSADFSFFRFYFGYKSEGCNSAGNGVGNSMSGSSRLGDSNDGGGALGSDYLMLELNREIPQEYSPYYAGWNASGALESDGGVSIHHPYGDVMKISTFQETPTSSAWGTLDTHWRVFWRATVNGHGVVESGSYGSGLFNAAGLLVGTLTGGASNCSEVDPDGEDLPDFFGKMSHHWSENPNPMMEKLRAILDPSGGNSVMFNGSSAPCVTGIQELGEQEVYSLSPNPASSELIISSSNHERFEYRIWDISGKLVLGSENSVFQKTSLNLSGFEIGVYFIEIQGGTKANIVFKFVVNR